MIWRVCGLLPAPTHPAHHRRCNREGRAWLRARTHARANPRVHTPAWGTSFVTTTWPAAPPILTAGLVSWALGNLWTRAHINVCLRRQLNLIERRIVWEDLRSSGGLWHVAPEMSKSA